ncbi:hypothetical protein PLESTB_000176800 [Pleodorina starrii]|uniref:Uncharacterized protein n=1 Tax=Pleodorina starrii TaxID=330485 RepID=A0A9W6EXL3_9CHLO|nr:hypothetical protein PLESTM_000520000 [Pleodorina starrii]GLC49048.1 hypothetical protein PLESTB_000176800 [Pleodorina starrii]GLC66158.1 hypothetical protein PLESTF_000391200 [Pleodorina starrii]
MVAAVAAQEARGHGSFYRWWAFRSRLLPACIPLPRNIAPDVLHHTTTPHRLDTRFLGEIKPAPRQQGASRRLHRRCGRLETSPGGDAMLAALILFLRVRC